MAPPTKRDWERWDDPGVIDEIMRLWASAAEMEHRRIIAAATLQGSPGSILEVGCGAGLLYRALLEAGMPNEKYVGVDTSLSFLARARALNPAGRFCVGDAFNLTESADTVLCAEVLGHIPEWRAPLREIIRAAQRRAVISMWIGGDARAEQIAGSSFLHNAPDLEDVVGAIRSAQTDVRVEQLRGESYLFTISK